MRGKHVARATRRHVWDSNVDVECEDESGRQRAERSFSLSLSLSLSLRTVAKGGGRGGRKVVGITHEPLLPVVESAHSPGRI